MNIQTFCTQHALPPTLVNRTIRSFVKTAIALSGQHSASQPHAEVLLDLPEIGLTCHRSEGASRYKYSVTDAAKLQAAVAESCGTKLLTESDLDLLVSAAQMLRDAMALDADDIGIRLHGSKGGKIDSWPFIDRVGAVLQKIGRAERKRASGK